MAHQVNRRKYLEALSDLSKVPGHLISKWWREDWILIDSNDKPRWPVGRPDSLHTDILYRLYKEYVLWTVEPVGIYNSENLGKVDDAEHAAYDH